ncbi:MAG: hypothetical protein AB7U46_04210 [Paenirhodobacter sp.]|uniref:hypothetical protein n=1 Tax=Paenirhodobacter sp. TaxID=1965326 RepID=UPI003D0A7DED
MPAGSHQGFKLSALTKVSQFDDVTADDIEEARQSLSLTPSEMAEALGWSPRKYSRTLNAARDEEVVSRDFALAVRGLIEVSGDRHGKLRHSVDDEAFLNGKTFEHIFRRNCDAIGGWSAEVAPHLLRLLVERVAHGGGVISYGETATMLEERGLTHRVWPRTAYGRPLGLICRALLDLGKQTEERIPLLSVIVTKAGGDPAEGIDGLLRDYLNLYELETLRKKKLAEFRQDRSALINEMQREALRYKHWSGVVRALLGREG